MTDKQIIVDSIDVTGCEHFSVHSGNGCRCYFLENEDTIIGCENYPNCYYKQLKRTESKLACKEQECEELKATLKVIADRPCLNINDCNGNCLPHCKWNAHKLAQEVLKELE